MNKKIAQYIRSRVTAAPGPYAFYIKAPAAGGYTAYANTLSTYKKLKAWAEKLGADVSLVHDTFQGGRKISNCHIVVEITDPAARLIEKEIEAEKENQRLRAEEYRQRDPKYKRFVRGRI